MPGGVHRMEFHFEPGTLAEKVQQTLQHRAKVFRGVYMQGGRAPQQAKGGNQTDKPEAMVAVQVGNEDMVEMREFEPGTAHLQLRPLSAVDHIEFFAHIDDLRRGKVAHGGKCRPAAQNRQFELFHDDFFIPSVLLPPVRGEERKLEQ